MLSGEPSGTECALHINRKERITGKVHDLQELSLKRFCSGKFSEAHLGRNLPSRCG